MRSTLIHPLLIAVLSLTLAPALADPGETPWGLEDLNAKGADWWVYNDINAAMAAARRTGKPLFVTFRCVPCKACAGFDAAVAKGSDRIQQLARKHFISVRQVEMKGVDLSLFEFDFDLNWAAMFVNGDGAVYGRYGTQSAEGPDAYNSIEGLEKAMRRVLALHKQYPRNAAALAGKRPARKPYKTALEMPGLLNREKRAGPTARNNCIHCHNIHDAQMRHAKRSGTFSLDMLNRYPLPENLGLHMDRDEQIAIARVDPESPAARAGIQPGDVITHASGQPIVSIADIQWVLHHLPKGDAQVTLKVSRDGQAALRTLHLASGWKKTDFTWRGSIWSLRPAPGFWAPLAKPNELKKAGLPQDARAFRVQWINRNAGGGKAAFSAGLRHGDLITAIADKPVPKTPKEFHFDVRFNYKPGQILPLTIRRNNQKREVNIKLVDE